MKGASQPKGGNGAAHGSARRFVMGARPPETQARQVAMAPAEMEEMERGERRAPVHARTLTCTTIPIPALATA